MNRHIEPSSIQGEGEGGTFDEVTAEMIFAAYPRRVEKAAALKAIRDAITAGNTPARLLERVTAYAAAVARWPEGERRYVPHPAKWIRGGSFDDDPREWDRRGGAEDGALRQKSASLGPPPGWDKNRPNAHTGGLSGV